MKTLKIIGFIFCICFFATNLRASPAKDEDFGFWTLNDIEAKVKKDFKVKLGEELRFREHAGISYYDTHFGISWAAAKVLVVGAEYLQERETRLIGKKDTWFSVECPRFFVTPQIKIKGFNLEDRNMLEIRIKENTENTARYRNMATITTPWKWTKLEIQPYVSNEMFFESNRNGFIEDRLYSGVRVHIWKGLQGSIFYLRQFTKNAAALWKESNILGMGFKASL